MIKYNEELDVLFRAWKRTLGPKEAKDFHCDGLMYKGKCYMDGLENWGRTRGWEDQLWHQAPTKIVFLMKEANGNRGEDIREWNGRARSQSEINGGFFTNIALWLYGIATLGASGVYLPFSEANRVADYTNAFDTFPLAIVNVKKQPGGGTAINSRLYSYNTRRGGRNSAYLKKELEILNPNIVVCGGADGTVKAIAMDLLFPNEFAPVNSRAYYAKGRDLVLIDSYHPSAWAVKPRLMYMRVMDAYCDFLKQGIRKAAMA